MRLEVQDEPVTGGYRIIDTERHEGYQGVATVTQRDAHPMVYDCLISHDEALERAKVMAAAPDLLEALKIIVNNAEQRVFEDWLVRMAPSGDCDSVQSQWLESSDYDDFASEWHLQITAIAKATA
ncbi:hypothetical protein [Pseudomonas sp. SLFW]|uniref:hypothetical protein n=1 Tax=Pseudomonas sp. SLFW TaxID=2683259 RepID=UPI001412EA33|nr:hypothetical protein [Pseudomonas sp. SLFW]NBB11788.1 hypothetical protein [Pseudomonas sp. SLFW]